MPKVLADLQAFADAIRKEIVDLKNCGAHCCTSAEFFQPAKGQWLHDEVGGDGEPFEELPKDVDGDQIPDIELADGQFI
jgi:hypothetical protein